MDRRQPADRSGVCTGNTRAQQDTCQATRKNKSMSAHEEVALVSTAWRKAPHTCNPRSRQSLHRASRAGKETRAPPLRAFMGNEVCAPLNRPHGTSVDHPIPSPGHDDHSLHSVGEPVDSLRRGRMTGNCHVQLKSMTPRSMYLKCWSFVGALRACARPRNSACAKHVCNPDALESIRGTE